MKEKIKKIMITTLCSMTAGTAIGCANGNTKIAQKINNGVNDFVSSINKLDYVDTNNTSSNLGKIVSAYNETTMFNTLAKNTNIENTITKPSERTDNFKLYVLSTTPYISLTSNDNEINLSMQFSTEKIETTSEDISEKINKLILKRAILMIYVNEIYSGNVTLTEENKKAINAYVNVIKENASFLNGNRGMVKNQLGLASNLLESETNNNIVNYYIIKSGEALEIRSNKINSTISAIESIINILEQNLTESSCYYQNNLTSTYENMLSNLTSSTATNENTEIAKNIAESINMISSTNNTSTQNSLNNQNIINSTNQTTNNITTKEKQNNYINNKSSNNNLMTLEEKTQNRNNNSKIQSNINQNNDNYNKLTPSQRAKLRRQERLNRQNNQRISETTNNHNPDNTNYISSYPQTNRTIRADRTQQNNQTNLELKDSNENQISNRQTNKSLIQNKNLSDNNNRAVRVPYKTTANQTN